jgi:hypothetical protein
MFFTLKTLLSWVCWIIQGLYATSVFPFLQTPASRPPDYLGESIVIIYFGVMWTSLSIPMWVVRVEHILLTIFTAIIAGVTVYRKTRNLYLTLLGAYMTIPCLMFVLGFFLLTLLHPVEVVGWIFAYCIFLDFLWWVLFLQFIVGKNLTFLLTPLCPSDVEVQMISLLVRHIVPQCVFLGYLFPQITWLTQLTLVITTTVMIQAITNNQDIFFPSEK